MGKLRKIVYLTEAQKETLFSEQTLTVNGVTINYNENDIYVTSNNNIPLSDIIATTNDNNKFLKVDTGVPTWSVLSSTDIPTISITDKTSGTLPVTRGGTGATSFTANRIIMSGNTTTSALTTREITNNTSNTAITNDNTNIPTMNTIYYGLVTVNNASQTRATGIYAPTSAGTANQILVSAGGTSAPTWKATANGAAYATSANGELTFGTLPVAQGGTGVTSIANIQAGKDGDGNTISSTYLKLSGGTLTGDLNFKSSSANSPDIVWFYGNTNKEQARIWMGDGGTLKWAPLYKCFNSSGESLYSGNLVLGDGTGASGTWGINITGSSASCTGHASSDLALTGGTMTGRLNINNSSTSGGGVGIWEDDEGGNISLYSPDGTEFQIDTYNNTVIQCHVAGEDGLERVVTFNKNTGALSSSGGFSGSARNITGIVAIDHGGTGATTATGARSQLDVPSTTGSGASGTWGISISGNAATASTAPTVSASEVSSANVDTMYTTGLYQIKSLASGQSLPVSTWACLSVFNFLTNGDNSRVAQVCWHDQQQTNDGTYFIRTCYNGTWTSWERIALTYNTGIYLTTSTTSTLYETLKNLKTDYPVCIRLNNAAIQALSGKDIAGGYGTVVKTGVESGTLVLSFDICYVAGNYRHAFTTRVAQTTITPGTVYRYSSTTVTN